MMLPIKKIMLGLGLLAVVQATSAAPITLDGDHFTVTYDTSELGPYNPGLVSGSQITVYFNSTSFQAMTPGGAGEPSVLLHLMLNIDPGYTFAGLSFFQDGNYYLLGDGSVRVTTDVTLANSATLDSVILGLDTGTDLNVSESLMPWQLSGALGLAGLGAPQTLLITLDTTLFADAVEGAAFIQNGYAGFQIMTAPAAVPEPGSMALVLAGIVAATLVGRRKSV